MSNTRRGLPLTSSRIEKIFPKLTAAQIDRIAAHGRIRSVQDGEVLIEQGDTSVPFFVVITGEVEIGFRFVKILPNYLDDVRSLNYASFIEWLNPNTLKVSS